MMELVEEDLAYGLIYTVETCDLVGAAGKDRRCVDSGALFFKFQDRVTLQI